MLCISEMLALRLITQLHSIYVLTIVLSLDILNVIKYLLSGAMRVGRG